MKIWANKFKISEKNHVVKSLKTGRFYCFLSQISFYKKSVCEINEIYRENDKFIDGFLKTWILMAVSGWCTVGWQITKVHGADCLGANSLSLPYTYYNKRKNMKKTGRNKEVYRNRQQRNVENQQKRAFGKESKDMPKVLFICHGNKLIDAVKSLDFVVPWMETKNSTLFHL